MTCDVPGYDALIEGLQDCADLLDRRDYDVWVAHSTDGEASITAERDESSVSISHTTDGQWHVTADAPDSPTLDEMWEDEWRVAADLRNWIDEAGLGDVFDVEDVADGFYEVVKATEDQDGWRVIVSPLATDEIECVTATVASDDYSVSIHYRGTADENRFVTYYGDPKFQPNGACSDNFGIAVTEAIQYVVQN